MLGKNIYYILSGSREVFISFETMSVEQWMYEWRNGSPKKSPTKTKAKVDTGLKRRRSNSNSSIPTYEERRTFCKETMKQLNISTGTDPKSYSKHHSPTKSPKKCSCGQVIKTVNGKTSYGKRCFTLTIDILQSVRIKSVKTFFMKLPNSSSK